jgi:hypothetical protein
MAPRGVNVHRSITFQENSVQKRTVMTLAMAKPLHRTQTMRARSAPTEADYGLLAVSLCNCFIADFR